MQSCFSHVQLFAAPWTAAYQAPPSTGFSRQEYWSGVPLPSPTYIHTHIYGASQVALVVKNLPANEEDIRDRFHSWVGKSPWRRARQPTPVFLPGEFHGQRSLGAYSPWGCKELDMTEATLHADIYIYICCLFLRLPKIGRAHV